MITTENNHKKINIARRKQEINRQISELIKTNGRHNIENSFELLYSIRQALDWHEMRAEIQQQKRKLQMLEARFRSVIDKNADSIIILDCRGIIRFANPATTSLFNCKVEELLGKELFDNFVLEKKACEIDTSIMSRESDNGTDDIRVVQTLVDIIPLRGEKAIAEMRVVETEWEGKIAFLVLLRDITARVRAEEALRQERDFSRTLVEASPAFFIAINPEGKVLMMNEAMLTALGYTLDEVISRDYLSKFVIADEHERLRDNFVKLIYLKTTLTHENRILTKDGCQLLVEWHSRPVFKASGELNFIFSVGLDITERKKAEEALRQSESQFRKQAQRLEQALQELQRTQAQLVQTEKMSSLGQMVAGVAHEINNPVNFITGNVHHAKEYIQELLELIRLYQKHYPEPVPEIQKYQEEIELDFLMEDLPKLLSSMELGTERIRKIVLSLRNFSRLDEAEKKSVNIHEGIDSTLLILHNRLKAKPGHPEIEVIKEYGELPNVECYAGQLNQVFMNILSNAIDALEQEMANPPESGVIKSPKIYITTALKDSQWVQIKIRDNGPGMNETVRRRLFDPFFTTKPIGKGTGLGLSISYQIVVEKHGGQLQCFSEPGKGAEFIVEIPIK